MVVPRSRGWLNPGTARRAAADARSCATGKTAGSDAQHGIPTGASARARDNLRQRRVRMALRRAIGSPGRVRSVSRRRDAADQLAAVGTSCDEACGATACRVCCVGRALRTQWVTEKRACFRIQSRGPGALRALLVLHWPLLVPGLGGTSNRVGAWLAKPTYFNRCCRGPREQ